MEARSSSGTFGPLVEATKRRDIPQCAKGEEGIYGRWTEK
jgi:hypothetical protein